MDQDLVKITFIDYPLVVHNLTKAIGNEESEEIEIVVLGCHDHHFPGEEIKADASFYGMYGDVTFAVFEREPEPAIDPRSDLRFLYPLEE